MLVCSVSLRPPRLAIAADVAETATALDAYGSGNVAFAALVDDPASALETLDAYLGVIMLEAASASDIVQIELAYDVAVDEAVTAADTLDAVTTGVGVVARQAMIIGAMVNSGTVSRQANANGVMVNM